jgi:hypothetical protein
MDHTSSFCQGWRISYTSDTIAQLRAKRLRWLDKTMPTLPFIATIVEPFRFGSREMQTTSDANAAKRRRRQLEEKVHDDTERAASL